MMDPVEGSANLPQDGGPAQGRGAQNAQRARSRRKRGFDSFSQHEHALELHPGHRPEPSTSRQEQTQLLAAGAQQRADQTAAGIENGGPEPQPQPSSNRDGFVVFNFITHQAQAAFAGIAGVLAFFNRTTQQVYNFFRRRGEVARREIAVVQQPNASKRRAVDRGAVRDGPSQRPKTSPRSHGNPHRRVRFQTPPSATRYPPRPAPPEGLGRDLPAAKIDPIGAAPPIDPMHQSPRRDIRRRRRGPNRVSKIDYRLGKLEKGSSPGTVNEQIRKHLGVISQLEPQPYPSRKYDPDWLYGPTGRRFGRKSRNSNRQNAPTRENVKLDLRPPPGAVQPYTEELSTLEDAPAPKRVHFPISAFTGEELEHPESTYELYAKREKIGHPVGDRWPVNKRYSDIDHFGDPGMRSKGIRRWFGEMRSPERYDHDDSGLEQSSVYFGVDAKDTSPVRSDHLLDLSSPRPVRQAAQPAAEQEISKRIPRTDEEIDRLIDRLIKWSAPQNASAIQATDSSEGGLDKMIEGIIESGSSSGVSKAADREASALEHSTTVEQERRKAEEEARRKAAEEAARKAEEEARRKAAGEEARRKAAEEARRKAAAEEELRQKAAAEEARKTRELQLRQREAAASRRSLMLNFDLSMESINAVIDAMKKTNGLHTFHQRPPLARRDLDTLLPIHPRRAVPWLNDEIINGYLTRLTDRYNQNAGWSRDAGKTGPVRPSATFNSNMYNVLENPQQGVKVVSRWSNRLWIGGKRLLKCDHILIPVNVGGNHWTLVHVSGKQKRIQYLDSMHGYSERIIAKIKEWLKFELEEKDRKDAVPFVESEWAVITNNSLYQLNGSDCGVFTCLNAEALVKGLGVRTGFHVNAGMYDARRRIAAILLNGGFEGEFEF